jgi:transposase
METGERVDVLPDRTADTLAAWLREHPGAELVCRDRGGAYAEAVRTAAPDAVQVADRFHVWRNLCEAVEKCVVLHRACLTEPASEEEPEQAASVPPEVTASAVVPAEWEGIRIIKRRERHAAVHELLVKGVGISAIAEALGLDRKTVRRYAHAIAPEDLAPARGARRGSRVDPFLPYLHERWNQGCTDAARLFDEIRERGYTGSQRTVRRHLQAVRASGKPAPKVTKQLSVRRATHLITSHPDHLDENATLRLKKLLARCPELEAVAACVESFAQMMADLDGHRLPGWLEQAEATGVPSLKSLVNGIRQDQDAVTAGLSMQWNSGRVEGNVNRIKRIKRDGYGRANFDLLRLQILNAD